MKSCIPCCFAHPLPAGVTIVQQQLVTLNEGAGRVSSGYLGVDGTVRGVCSRESAVATSCPSAVQVSVKGKSREDYYKLLTVC